MGKLPQEGFSHQMGKGKAMLRNAAMKGMMVIVVIFLAPLCAGAMTRVSDAALSDVTGQAGVSINADIIYDIHFDTCAWGDSDGLGGTTTGGYVGITDYYATGWRIKTRESDTYGGYDAATMWKPVTIDVATSNMYSLLAGYGNSTTQVTFVRIGLGALLLTGESSGFNVELGPTHDLGQTLFTFYGGYGEIFINPRSYIDIYAHNGCGVNLTLDVQADRIYFANFAWGDLDGLPGGNIGDSVTWMGTDSTAGYVGLKDILLDGPITLTGTIAIDVATSNSGVYYDWNGSNPVSVVHISTPTDVNIGIAKITTTVCTDSQQDLRGPNAGELGNLYISDLNLSLHAGSWVDIWAH